MSNTGVEKSVKVLWVVGNCVWCSVIFILSWHGYDAQAFSGALTHPFRFLSLLTPGRSYSIMQALPLELLVSGLGICWAFAGQAWLSRFSKTRQI